jgi:hypothetical protein
MACFSASLQHRRVPATTEYRREKLPPDIVADLALAASTSTNKSHIYNTPQGGLRRTDTTIAAKLPLDDS